MRPTRGVNRGYQAGILRADGSLARFSAVCAPTVYRGDRLPAELYGNVFVADPAGNLVSRDRRERRRHHAARDEGLRSRGVHRLDRRAVPARLPVVGARRDALRRRPLSRHHPAPRLHHRVPARSDSLAVAREADRARTHLARGARHARGAAPIPRSAAPRPARSSQALSHPNGWWRDTAQQLLVQRNDKAAVEPLKTARGRDRRRRARVCTRSGPSTAWTASTRRA